MAKRKKRNAITLVSLLLLLAVLIGVYYWYSNKPADTEKTEEEDTTIALATVDKEQVNSLHYRYGDTDITFVFKDEVWISEAEPDRPIEQSKISSLIGVVDDISATRLIAEEPDNLADYGLENPISYLQATLEDGTTVTLEIGNKVSGGSGYYGMVNEDNKVYLLSTIYGSGLQYDILDFTSVEDGPTITAENIQHISIDNRDSEDFEVKYIPNYGFDHSGSSTNTWFILKPYGEGVSADSEAISGIQANYTSFDYTSCVDYDAEDLSIYGLDNPLASIYVGYFDTSTVPLEKAETDPETGEEITEKTIAEAKEYKIYVGNQDDAGYYYVKTEKSNAIYTIAADKIDKMLQVDTFSLFNPFILIPNIATVDKVVIAIDGKDFTMEIKRNITTNEAGEEETEETYFFNGDKTAEDTFKDLYQVIIALSYDNEIKNATVSNLDEPVMSVKFHLTNGSSVSASYLPYDESFYRVDHNNQIRFLANKRAVDDAIKAMVSYTAKVEEE